MVAGQVTEEPMKEADLKQILQAGTRLVLDAACKRISIPDFIREYGNFYYYNALDGHEASDEGKRLLEKYAEATRLHAEVQQCVVDLTYLGDASQKEAYLQAGRIEPDEALRRLERLVKEHEAAEILSRIDSR
jgi:hypothetical protein